MICVTRIYHNKSLLQESIIINLGLQAQFESLAVIREDYRKNSLKCGANHSPGYVQSDEEEDTKVQSDQEEDPGV